MAAGIYVDKVRKVFGTFEALKSVSLDVQPEEFTVLLGPSGCGKTTLLRIIAGLETETSGELRIGDKRVNGLPPRNRNIAMVFQNYAVFPHLTIFENIAFGLRMKKLLNSEIEPRVKKAAGMMHIEHLLDRYSAQLSGGQRQRVAVARALAMEPEVLLMDEPLSNLDALLRLEMRAELKGLLAESRTTTIYVTHDQVEAMSLADRIAVMHGGHIIQYDRPIEVYQNPANAFCGGFIGNPPMNFLQAERENGHCRIAGAALPGPSASQGNGRVTLGIRPEDVLVAETAASEHLTGRVTVVEPLGPHNLLTLAVDQQLFRVTTAADSPIKSGQEVYLALAPERRRWFDTESGKALH
ncbi:ABC transporter ATP-binding protein [Pelagibius litoralis]|uniref:ABC transporter ATP-binding protein n=1 Tax=Pelagibius litoralis TaxID=374515 RepID=A0A967F249_9PROT|nr:ABC transporter ATP-binding protein [Pelagibius litoralis]NIA71778.1 ABC transporter ATP-binding protein [Pelagibius litoralis]